MKTKPVPTMVMLVTLFFVMSIPVKAQVSDWKEYTVVCVEVDWRYSDAISGLIDEVNEMINYGWQPLGGLVIEDRYPDSFLACQAMVKD